MSFQCGAFQQNAYQNNCSAAPPVQVPTGGGGRYFAWSPDEPKKKPAVQIAIETVKDRVVIKYVAIQPIFPAEALQSIQEIFRKNTYRKKELLRLIEEAEEEENILIILSELN